MANVVARGTASPVSGNPIIINPPSFVTLNPPTNAYLPPAIAGEALTPGMACHFSADGKVYASFGGGATAYAALTPAGADPNGTDANLAVVDGYVAEQVTTAGEAVTLVKDLVFDWCNVAQTVGKKLFVSNTIIGGLDDAASTNGTVFVAKVVGEAPATTTSTKVLCLISRV